MTPKDLLNAANCEMKVICGRDWDEFEETELEGVRFCTGCKKAVFYTRTIQELKVAAEKQLCVYLADSFDLETYQRNERIKAIEAAARANIGNPTTGHVILKNKK